MIVTSQFKNAFNILNYTKDIILTNYEAFFLNILTLTYEGCPQSNCRWFAAREVVWAAPPS